MRPAYHGGRRVQRCDGPIEAVVPAPVGRNEQLEPVPELRSPVTHWVGDRMFARFRPVALFRQVFRRPRSGLREKSGLEIRFDRIELLRTLDDANAGR
jgi:hypothetical protein